MPGTTDAPWTADITVDLSTARSVLRRAVPALADQPLSVLGEGWDNLVVAVGEECLLRLPRRHLGATLLSGELDFLTAWADALPAPVPRILERIPPGADYPFSCALVARVAGLTADRAPPPDRRSVGAALGGFLRTLHDLPPTLPSGATPRGDTIRRADLAHRRVWLHGRIDALLADVPGVDAAPARAASSTTSLRPRRQRG